MRVLHLLSSLNPDAGGPPRSVGGLCGGLAELPCVEANLLVQETPGDTRVSLHKKIRVHISARDTSAFAETLKTLLNEGIDVVHGHGVWLPQNHLGISLTRRRGIPYVLSPRGMLEPWALQSKWLKKKIAWILYVQRNLQKATAFHATSQQEADSIRRLGFKQPIAVIANGVELPMLPEAAEKRPHAGWIKDKEEGRREECPLSSEPASDSPFSPLRRSKTALFLSRINPKKGLPMLLDVWAKIRPEGWQLVIAGNDDANHLQTVEAKIREHGLENVVKLVGPLFDDAKAKAFASADLFVLPSYSENFGIVVTEALAYEVPVLTTTGCPWQELDTHKCGWWVEPTHEGIEAGLRKAFSTTEEERVVMGECGRTLVEENYLWPAIADKMLRFYEWVLHGGEMPEFVV